MKRFLTALTAVLLAVLLCCSAGFAAESYSYYLEEMDADIALPSWDDYFFLYPDMPADSEDLEILELTPEDINGILVPYGILFNALYFDATHEISVMVNEDEISRTSFNLLEVDQAALSTVEGAVVADLELMGAVDISVEWVNAANACWMILEYALPDGGSWIYQYSTVYNGKNLIFTSSSAYGVELTDEIRGVVADMALGTQFRHRDNTPEGSGAGSLPGGVDLSGMDLEAMADALGLTMEEMMALAQGEMELSELDLGKIDLEGLVNAAGMTEADLFEMIRSESGLDSLDLSVVDLDEIDLEALVAALGITEEEAFALIEGKLDPAEVDLSGMDVPAVLAALGLTVEDVIDIIMPLVLESIGLENMDWKGLLGGIGKGLLIGTVAGVAVVILIIVLLAVTGRKKREQAQMEISTLPKED